MRGAGSGAVSGGREEEGTQAQGIAHACALPEDDLCVLKGVERGLWCWRSPQVGGGGRSADAHPIDFVNHMRDFGFCLKIKREPPEMFKQSKSHDQICV